MGDRREDIMERLRRAGEETVAFFGGMTASQLETPVYDETVSWTVRRLLAHLVTIEMSMHWLFRNILEGGPGAPEDFDIDRFNRTQPQKLDGLSLAEAIRRFQAVRAETVAMVEGMSEGDLNRRGRHPFHGPGTLERFIRWAYEHADLHEEDARGALSRAPSGPP